MTKSNYAKAHEMIAKYCIDEEELDSETAYDVAFHMTDWADDLESLIEFYEKPDEFSSEQLGKILYDFLYHVPQHVAAAAKLLLDTQITDVFDVGVIGTGEKE